MTYISTEHLFKCETCRHCKGEIKCDTFCDTGEQYIPDMSKIPTADVVEVKHGEWIYHECVSSYEGATSGYSCSECCAFVDELEVDTDSFHKEYCGNCGAKMDGKKEGLKV